MRYPIILWISAAQMRSWFSKTDSPFKDQPKLIFHGAYHKMGTIWFTNLLRKIGESYGLSIQIGNRNDECHDGSDILIANHSQTDLSQLEDYVGTHLIRDPRDAIVSGYFYHLWTNEGWAHQPHDEYDGMSYQAFLKSQSQEEGLKAEIRRFAKYIQHYRMLAVVGAVYGLG